ncbi:MAG: DUF5357 domain-containing protein [Cyanobacteria bacterium CRU_2_1]|nr:DUF5357 domain-containing protein [Cyanobacteria bacterium CRU_2_1]
MRKYFDHIKGQMEGIKPFSWQTSLLTSLFCWFIYLLLDDLDAKRFVSVFGWFFLIVGVDWVLLLQERATAKTDKEFNIPIFDLKFRLSPWISGALTCLAFYSLDFLIYTFRDTLVAWPLFSAAIGAFPKFLKPGPTLKVPDDVGVRQDLVTLVLLAILYSCWFQFTFFVQDLLQQYPSLLADDFDRSQFVVRTNRQTIPTTNGVVILDNAEAAIRSKLNGRSWVNVQRWLRNIDEQVPSLNQQIKADTFGNPPRVGEAGLWQFDANYTDVSPEDVLNLQAIWSGPSSKANGYILEKTCFISQAPVQITPAPASSGQSYQMTCQSVTSISEAVNFGRDER